MKPETICGEIDDNNNIICPHCGSKTEGWDVEFRGDEEKHRECDECGGKYIATKAVKYTYTTTAIVGEKDCQPCNGTGRRHQYGIAERRCYHCNGTGKMPKTGADLWLEEYRAIGVGL